MPTFRRYVNGDKYYGDTSLEESLVFLATNTLAILLLTLS